MQVRLKLEYDGTNYSGWQMQSGQDSIQARLEEALARILGTPVRVRGAGRTDAGVHARGQVAAARLPRAFDPAELARALNAILPADIVVLEAAAADEAFDPRRDARLRIYEYRVLNQPLRSAFERNSVWLVREPLDIGAMNAAAGAFAGEHDFAAFRSLGSAEKTTMRRVEVSRWRRDDERLVYRVEASAFLRHMVRTMVAAMVEVGRGKSPGRPPADTIAALLLSHDRALAPAPAPAAGLYLVEVRY
ncbi:MAG TPA: tRNA pseudouridine(38-40) synthase TruA [Candidatus Binataceae bacterium]|jgi:tRNA pseudouridine38-40 synthase|nr:tRNA pseudouridine(38-40) synthase TruA [Candidatus Binataceae bacterium]